MQICSINDFTRGWLIGHFSPSLIQTDKFEVGFKSFIAGEEEQAHYHKLTREITVVLSGVVEMCGKRLGANDIIILEPGEVSSFKCIEDATTCAIRDGSFAGDKYELNQKEG